MSTRKSSFLLAFMPLPASAMQFARPCGVSRARRAWNRAAFLRAFQSPRDPDEFFIHTRWKDLRAFEEHVELPHTVRFVAEVEPLLDHPFKATVAEKIW